jgi:two-component system, response regulator RegA
MTSITRFLLVEDDPQLGPITCKALEKRGFSAHWAQTQEDALALCAHWSFDVAVLDLKLQNGHSLGLIPALRERFPALRILMLTGYASIATTVEAIKAGANNYLPKPASLKDIFAALELPLPDLAPEPESPEESADAVMSSRRLEWEHIQRVLAQNQGNVSAAARELNMHRRTLQRKLQKKPVAQ